MKHMDYLLCGISFRITVSCQLS